MAVTLITGGSTGIGRQAALALAEAGLSVYASCRNPRGACGPGSALPTAADIPVLGPDLLDSAGIEEIREVCETIGKDNSNCDVKKANKWMAKRPR